MICIPPLGLLDRHASTARGLREPAQTYLHQHRHAASARLADARMPVCTCLCVYACVLQVELVFRYVFLAQVGSLPAVFDAALLAPVY